MVRRRKTIQRLRLETDHLASKLPRETVLDGLPSVVAGFEIETRHTGLARSNSIPRGPAALSEYLGIFGQTDRVGLVDDQHHRRAVLAARLQPEQRLEERRHERGHLVLAEVRQVQDRKSTR